MNTRSVATSRRRAPALALALIALAAFDASSASAAPLYPQCPAVGNNLGCSQLIVVQADGTIVVQVDPSGPVSGYDGAEDTLIGLQNNSKHSVSSINLASANVIFGFDVDGLCNPAQWPSAPPVTPPNCPGPQGFGATGYEGPNNTFSNISANKATGTVNFKTPVAPGGSTYWGLEEALQAGQLLSGASGHPITGKPVVSHHTVIFGLVCVGAMPCNGVARLVVIEHRKGKAWIAKARTRKVTVGSVGVSIPAGGSGLVSVSLSKKGGKLLSTVSSLPVLVQVSLNSSGGRVLTSVGTAKFKGHKHRKP